MNLIKVVLTTFCIMVDKLESGHLGVFLSIIELAWISTSNLLLGKLLSRQENHKAEIGAFESYQAFNFQGTESSLSFSLFSS